MWDGLALARPDHHRGVKEGLGIIVYIIVDVIVYIIVDVIV